MSRASMLQAGFRTGERPGMILRTGAESKNEVLTCSVTPNATANTKGSWAQVIASVATDVHGVTLIPGSTATTSADSSWLLDIGTGGAGSEVVVAANIACGFVPSASSLTVTWVTYEIATYIPIFIARGSRIAIRAQSAETSKAAVSFYLILHSDPRGTVPATTITTYGASTTNSRGVSVTPGTLSSKGSWVEVTASTTEPLRAIFPRLQGDAVTVMNNESLGYFDIGIGAAGSETVIIPDIMYATTSSETINLRSRGKTIWNVTVPAGSRLAVRAAVSSSTATGRGFDVCLYGIPARY